MQSILILDLAATGHHPRYLNWVANAEVCREAEVTIAAVGELLQHPEVIKSCSSARKHTIRLTRREEVSVRSANRMLGLVRRQFAVYRIYRRVFNELGGDGSFDLVFLVCADDLLEAITAKGSPFGRAKWAGIAMRPRFHFREMGICAPPPRAAWCRKWSFRRLLRMSSLAGIFTIDCTLADFAAMELPESEGEKVVFLPDPAPKHTLPKREAARREFGIDLSSKVILAYGGLTGRKGIKTLIATAGKPDCPEGIHLLLAGRQASEIRDAVATGPGAALKAQGRLHALDRYLSDADEAKVLAASDCVWVGYEDFYAMSGVLVLAGRHGLPCIGTRRGIIGYLISHHRLGIGMDPGNLDEALMALRQVAENPDELKSAGSRARAVFDSHSISQFQSTISRQLNSTKSFKSPT